MVALEKQVIRDRAGFPWEGKRIVGLRATDERDSTFPLAELQSRHDCRRKLVFPVGPHNLLEIGADSEQGQSDFGQGSLSRISGRREGRLIGQGDIEAMDENRALKAIGKRGGS